MTLKITSVKPVWGVPIPPRFNLLSNHFSASSVGSPGLRKLSWVLKMENASSCPYLEAIGARWEAHSLTEGTFKNLVAITTINSIAVVPTITLNGLVIIAVATRHRLRSKSNMLLAFLAVTGLLFGLLSQPLRIALELKRIFNVGPFCTAVEKGSILISIALSPATVGHLILISIDWYIAIKNLWGIGALSPKGA